MKLFKVIPINLWIMVMLLSFGSCADDSITESIEEIPQSVKTTKLTLDEALAHAEEMFSVIEGNTRSKSRKVAKVKEIYGSSHTRGDNTNPLFYLVNYEDNEGFALLGADERVEPVYAISSKGKLNMEDTVRNIGLAVFMNDIIQNAEYELQNAIIVQPGTSEWKFDNVCSLNPRVPECIAKFAYGAKEFGANNPTWISSEVLCFYKLIYGFGIFNSYPYDTKHLFYSKTLEFVYSECLHFDDKTLFYNKLLKPAEDKWQACGKDYFDFITTYSSNIKPYRDKMVTLEEDPMAINGPLGFSSDCTFPWELDDGEIIDVPLTGQCVIAKTKRRTCIDSSKDPAAEVAFLIDGSQEFLGYYYQFGSLKKTARWCYYHCLWGTGDDTDGYYRSFHYPYNIIEGTLPTSNPNIENTKGSLSTPITVFPPMVLFHKMTVGVG